MNSNQWRNRRNQLNWSPIPAYNMYSIANYSTDQSKTDLSKTFADEMLIHNLHMMPNPLQKNLADTIPTAEKAFVPKMETIQQKEQPRSESFSIAGFFSGVISAISSGVFRRREPAPQYYDCYDRQLNWQTANEADLNKSTRSQSLGGDDAMSADCRSAAAHCEDKLNRVRHLLSSKPVPTTPKYRRKPKRAFIEPGSVEESFEDAFSPEDFVRLSNSDRIECISPVNNHNQEVIEAAAVTVKTEVKEVMDIVQMLPGTRIAPVETKMQEDTKGGKTNLGLEAKSANRAESKSSENHIETKMELKQELVAKGQTDSKNNLSAEKTIENHIEIKLQIKPDRTVLKVEPKDNQEIISTCEDKVNRLKALLQCRKPKSRLTKTEPEVKETVVDKIQDKHFKNPSRTTDKRKQSQLIKNIQEDMCFGNSLDTEEVSSPDNSPILQPTKLCDMINFQNLIPEPEPEYFDEIQGRFRSASTDSDDSFQIVFTDSPKARHKTVSECDSEDSFIVFEDSPDSCYTSHDVFGDSTAESDSEVSDSGCGSCKLSHSLTRTVGDLTDDSLFDNTVREESEDEVDSVTVCEELPEEVKNTGLLLSDAKKVLRRQQPSKKVSFSEQPPKVHVLRVWAFAARQARRGTWEQDAMDRDRFKRKIADVDMAVSWVLKPQHRRRIMFQRFMPWWNKQRRLEAEERKRKAEEDKRREEERVKEEERLAEERVAEGEDNESSGVKEDIITEGNLDTESANNVDKDLDGKREENGLTAEIPDVIDTNTKDRSIELNTKDGSKLANDVNIEFNNVDKVNSNAKTLAKCDFYDKSDKHVNTNLNLTSNIIVDT